MNTIATVIGGMLLPAVFSLFMTYFVVKAALRAVLREKREGLG